MVIRLAMSCLDTSPLENVSTSLVKFWILTKTDRNTTPHKALPFFFVVAPDPQPQS